MSVPVVTTIAELRREVARARQMGWSIGLVPTMGALHAGHASLMRAARAETGFVVLSIFVNPTQFGPNEDFTRYPRTLPEDLEVCAAKGVDLVFAPDAATMYPPGFRTYVEVHGLQDVLEGASRPGHFRGVATVVLKLFHQVQPDRAYFGQKDAQQALLIRQMVRDLDVPVQLRICPIVREPDGLALSSRNRYLDSDQRRQATALFEALEAVRSRVAQGERRADQLRRMLEERIRCTPGAQLDYAVIVHADTLEPVEEIHGPVLVALAVKFGTTRLIDNLMIGTESAL
jgi:pantoate--beta-alanine ligase